MGMKLIVFVGDILGLVFLTLMGYVAVMWCTWFPAATGGTCEDLGSAVTGGLLTNLGAITTLPVLGNFGPLIGVLLGTVFLILFPLDWALTYRPGDVIFFLWILIPWAVAGILNALVFAKNAKQGFAAGLVIMIIPVILGVILSFVLANLLGGVNILDLIFTGLVNRGFIAAIFTATLEGGALAGVFGSLIGALKYKPDGSGGASKKKKGNKREGAEKKEDVFVDFD
ncbi:MAG TPA: hypothetical protein VKK79_22355 [Candidatus Lokiarchaeia archaeon]|nr:hypothetical protein [Candidatus Lokiarchaeia archaeon]